MKMNPMIVNMCEQIKSLPQSIERMNKKKMNVKSRFNNQNMIDCRLMFLRLFIFQATHELDSCLFIHHFGWIFTYTYIIHTMNTIFMHRHSWQAKIKKLVLLRCGAFTPSTEHRTLSIFLFINANIRFFCIDRLNIETFTYCMYKVQMNK